MLEVWDTGRYHTYQELGKEFGCSADTARKAIAQAQREREKKRI
jgi:DNA-binding GntR family transcriptional regulator